MDEMNNGNGISACDPNSLPVSKRSLFIEVNKTFDNIIAERLLKLFFL
jgi:hypothetical protein